MPRLATRNPPPQQQALTNIVLRGPFLSTHLPKNAADSPSRISPVEYSQATCGIVQSPGAD